MGFHYNFMIGCPIRRRRKRVKNYPIIVLINGGRHDITLNDDYTAKEADYLTGETLENEDFEVVDHNVGYYLGITLAVVIPLVLICCFGCESISKCYNFICFKICPTSWIDNHKIETCFHHKKKEIKVEDKETRKFNMPSMPNFSFPSFSLGNKKKNTKKPVFEGLDDEEDSNEEEDEVSEDEQDDDSDDSSNSSTKIGKTNKTKNLGLRNMTERGVDKNKQNSKLNSANSRSDQTSRKMNKEKIRNFDEQISQNVNKDIGFEKDEYTALNNNNEKKNYPLDVNETSEESENEAKKKNQKTGRK